MSARRVSLGGVDLQTYEFRTTALEGLLDSSKSELFKYPKSRNAGAFVPFTREQGRDIAIVGYLIGDTVEEADRLMIILKRLKAISKTSPITLLVEEDGELKSWQVVLSYVGPPPGRGRVNFRDFRIEMFAGNPFGESQTLDTLLDENITSTPTNFPISVGGSAPMDPLLAMTINSISPAASSITFGSSYDYKRISIARTWVAGDRIDIRTEYGQQRVFLNSRPFNGYSGLIPSFHFLATNFDYFDDATTRDVDVNIKYRKRWD